MQYIIIVLTLIIACKRTNKDLFLQPQTKTESTMIDIRQRVKDLCKQKGIMQKELAARMGITEVALSMSLRPDRKTKKPREPKEGEGGKQQEPVTYPSMETLKRIADALEIEIEDIFATDEVVSRHQANVSNSIRCPYCGAELELSKNPSNMTGEEIKAEIERLKAMVTDEPNYRLLTSEELAELEKMRQEWNATHEEQIP